MFRRFSVNFAIFSMVLDALLVAAALALATHLRPALNQLSFAQQVNPDVRTPLPVYPIFMALWVVVLLVVSVYDGRKNLRVVNELTSLTFGIALAAIASAGVLYLSYRDVSRLLFITFVLLAFVFLASWRLMVRLAWRRRNLQPSRRRVLIVGAGKVGQRICEQITQHGHLGLEFVGFLDDERNLDEVIGYLDEARTLVTEHRVDDVVIALPGWAYERVNHLVAELHDVAVKVWVIPDYFSITLHRATVDEFAGIPMLDLRAPALSDYKRMLKRVFDLVLCILALPVALPLMGVIALAIRLDSPGPVLFRQQRVGENGRLFEMYKFRSMVMDAEERREQVEQMDAHGNIIHKRINDPRITRVGALLRRTSLDELPQIVNVLKGEMSLVGPRPELPYLVEKYEPWQRKRFAVPQGITGWWQINGRSDRPMHLHTEDDLYYVQNYSIALDLLIILRTFWAVLRGQGAY